MVKMMIKKTTFPDFLQSDITSCLLSWYQVNARSLPWRRTHDPYAIWISEVMLQQTRVETVIPYYRKFLKQFPTVAALAAAPEQEVLKVWEGLGYYRRARLLIKGANVVMERFGGQLPDKPETLAVIPGIGDYMSGSIASIAFNLPVPAVDGNVIRLVTRIIAWPEDSGTANSKRTITDWVRSHFPIRDAANFTQALMEMGALVCLPRNPLCFDCPVKQFCKAFCDQQPEHFPVKKATRELPSERRVVLRITWKGRHLLQRRPQKGLMAGFWEYPNLLAQPDADAAALAERWSLEYLGVSLPMNLYARMTHVYTHLRWNLEIYDAQWPEAITPRRLKAGVWLLPEEEEKLPRVAFIRQLNK
jgi:A/G-specific adenine glycosylase